MLADVSSALIYPLIAIVVGGVITYVVSTIIGRKRDERKEQVDAVEDERRKKDDLVALLQSQVQEMHVALLGADKTAWNPHPAPGIVSKVDRIEATLFGNGGNSMLDRVTRIENNQKAPVDGT